MKGAANHTFTPQALLSFYDPGLEPHQSVEDFGSTAMLATKRSAGVTPEVKLREHVTHTPPTIVKKGRADINRSPKQGHQCPKKGLMSSKIFFLKIPILRATGTRGMCTFCQ